MFEFTAQQSDTCSCYGNRLQLMHASSWCVKQLELTAPVQLCYAILCLMQQHAMLEFMPQCCREIQQAVEGPARVLQEAVAEDAAQRLLALDARVSAVQLYIRKPHVALPGVLDSIGAWCLQWGSGRLQLYGVSATLQALEDKQELSSLLCIGCHAVVTAQYLPAGGRCVYHACQQPHLHELRPHAEHFYLKQTTRCMSSVLVTSLTVSSTASAASPATVAYSCHVCAAGRAAAAAAALQG
jgi:hypothetical protein